MVPMPGRGWSARGAEVADSRKAALTTRQALDQDVAGDQSENGWRPVEGRFLVRKPVSVAG